MVNNIKFFPAKGMEQDRWPLHQRVVWHLGIGGVESSVL